MQFPKRHFNHTLEQKSETFFRKHLPQDWNITIPTKDYGQDLNLEICEDGQYRGLDLIVQLKSSEKSDILNNNERQQLKVSTYNYLSNNLRVVLIVKFIEAENEAYWILLKDIQPPINSEQESFTIYFPMENKISTIDWTEITDYVREVTDTKLAALRTQNRLRNIESQIDNTIRENKDDEELLSNCIEIKQLLQIISQNSKSSSTEEIQRISNLQKRIDELEIQNEILEKKLIQQKAQNANKTQFEEIIRLKQENEIEKERVYRKLGLPLAIFNAGVLINEKKYNQAIKNIKNDIKFILTNLNQLELDEYHEQYFQLVFFLITCYLKTHNYKPALFQIENSFQYSKRILEEYNYVEQEKQFVMVCEYYFEILKYGIENSWIKRKYRIKKATEVYCEFLSIGNKRPFLNRTEAHRFKILIESFKKMLFTEDESKLNNENEGKALTIEEVFELANEKMQEEKYEEAFSIYTNLIEGGSKRYEVYLMRGVVSGLLKDYDSAIKDFDLALYHNPNGKEAYVNKGSTLLKIGGSGNCFIANINFDKALKIDDNFVEAYVNRGLAYIQDGKKNEACLDFHKALELGYEPANELINSYCLDAKS